MVEEFDQLKEKTEEEISRKIQKIFKRNNIGNMITIVRIFNNWYKETNTHYVKKPDVFFGVLEISDTD